MTDDDRKNPTMTYKKTALLIILIVSALGLSGCFKSEQPLISAGDADFPFTTITYADPNGTEYTLEKSGDAYLSTEDGDETALRLTAIDENTFIGQIFAEDDGGDGYLYALVEVSEDRKSFSFVHPVAGEQALAAANQGTYGFRPCDDGFVCISTLDGFEKFASATPQPDDSTVIFTIKNLQ